jgi:hypothetical protein
MGLTHIKDLKPGMVLDEEVRDINGRLLLKKDKEIQSSHIRIFKIWGITEVNVQGSNGDKSPSSGTASPESLEKIKENTKNLFRHVDLEHPAIKEIFRISVEFRSKHNLDESEKIINLKEIQSKSSGNGNDFLQKLKDKKLIVVDDLKQEKISTKKFVEKLQKLPSKDMKSLVVIAEKNDVIQKSSANLEKIKTINISNINILDILAKDYMIMTKFLKNVFM